MLHGAVSCETSLLRERRGTVEANGSFVIFSRLAICALSAEAYNLRLRDAAAVVEIGSEDTKMRQKTTPN